MKYQEQVAQRLTIGQGIPRRNRVTFETLALGAGAKKKRLEFVSVQLRQR